GDDQAPDEDVQARHAVVEAVRRLRADARPWAQPLKELGRGGGGGHSGEPTSSEDMPRPKRQAALAAGRLITVVAAELMRDDGLDELMGHLDTITEKTARQLRQEEKTRMKQLAKDRRFDQEIVHHLSYLFGGVASEANVTLGGAKLNRLLSAESTAFMFAVVGAAAGAEALLEAAALGRVPLSKEEAAAMAAKLEAHGLAAVRRMRDSGVLQRLGGLSDEERDHICRIADGVHLARGETGLVGRARARL
ncbi:hypothetical protein Rsub_06053, partial [Raphidocelis subcapitata]